MNVHLFKMHVYLFIRNLRPFHVIEHIFSTGTNDRQILGHLVARHWAVFVFDLRNPRPFHVIEHNVSTGIYNEQILGRLVARHWAVFVFDLRNPTEVGGGNPWTMVTSDDFLPRSQSIP